MVKAPDWSPWFQEHFLFLSGPIQSKFINPRPHLLFHHPRLHLGVGVATPRLVCPLIEIELRNKDKRKDRDVLNLTIPDFTTLGHILTFPGQVKQKMLLFGKIKFFCE